MKSVTSGLLLVAMLLACAAPGTRSQEAGKAPQSPSKESGVKKVAPRLEARADLGFSCIDGVGPAATADPDGDGCLMQQEYKVGVKNFGLVDAPSFVVRLTTSNSFTKEARVVKRRVSALKPGESVILTFKFGMVADGYDIRLDEKGEVTESKEENNRLLESCEGGVWLAPCK